MSDRSTTQIVDRVIGMRLRQFQQAMALPVVFGGATAAHRTGRRLNIAHARGVLGSGLVGLGVGTGRGLGGSALMSGSLRMVHDYASTRTITHDFDGIVVKQEHISAIFALPVVVGRTVEAVIYGGVRGQQRIGDAVLERATAFGRSLELELSGMLSSPAPAVAEQSPLHHTRAAVAELGELARTTSDPLRRTAIARLVAELSAVIASEQRPGQLSTPRPLAPREVDVLRLVAVGMANSEVAISLGLSVETVRAYLRSALRKLGVGNRTAAVHAARQLGCI